jgi:hypothetical protein
MLLAVTEPAAEARPQQGVLPLGDRIRRRLRRELVAPLQRRTLVRIRRWRNRSREYRPVFIAGAMGSGTTLLTLSLEQRFECACAIEESALQVASDSFLYVPDLEGYDSIRSYGNALEPRPDWSGEGTRRDLTAMYRAHGRGQSDLVFDKGPNVHLVRAGLLSRAFPEARFVAIFRDPVVVIEGFRRKWRRFGADPLEESLRFYRHTHERFLEHAAALGERLVVVRYEDLVAHYERVLDALGAHFGAVPRSGGRRLASRANVEGQGIRNVRGGRIEVVRDGNRGAYRRLDPATVERIRSELGPVDARLRARAWSPEVPTAAADPG